MSNEDLRERRNRGPLDSLESVTMAALAVGAGAALLYKGEGHKLMSDGVRKATQLFNTVANETSTMALKDFDSKGIKSLWNKHVSGESSTWKQLSELDGKLVLNQESNKSLIGTLRTVLENRRNNMKVLNEQYDAVEIKGNLYQDLVGRFGQGKKELAGKIQGFIDDTLANGREAFSIVDTGREFNTDFVKKHFGDKAFNPTQQAEIMRSMLNALDYKKDRGLTIFAEQNKHIVKNIEDEMMNLDNLARSFGLRGQESRSKKIKNEVLHQQATLGELFSEENVGNILDFEKEANGISHADIQALVKEYMDKDSRYADLYVDNTLLKDGNGKLYSIAETADFFHKVTDELANTLPGKILKARDIRSTMDSPKYAFFAAGRYSPFLASLEEGNTLTRLQKSYAYIHGKFYSIEENGSLKHFAAADGMRLFSGQHGTIQRLSKTMANDADVNKAAINTPWKRFWDVGTSAQPTKLRELGSIITKFNNEDYGRNLVDFFLKPDTKQTGPRYVENFFGRLRQLDRFMSENTRMLDRNTVMNLHKHASVRSKSMLELLQQTDDGMLTAILGKTSSELESVRNTDLRSMIKRLQGDLSGKLDQISIQSNKHSILNDTRAVHTVEKLRKEIAKEAFLQEYATTNNKDVISQLFRRSGISGERLKEAQHLANWAMVQNESGLYSSSMEKIGLDEATNRMRRVQTLFSSEQSGGYSGQSEYADQFRESMKIFAKEKAPILQKGFQVLEEDLNPGHNYGAWLPIKKTVGVLDVIKNINDETITKGFMKQWTAGRDNLKDVTIGTMFPYFGLMRLMDPLQAVGLGFSSKSAANVGSLAWNIMTKRVAPVAGALTALSYLDYEAENLTGTSLRGAAANSLANIDLTNRKIADALGMTEFLKDERRINPIAQYWFGDEYQDYEERKEWYEDGYSPVRKGRWWSFGSTSEFRGGKIDYWQPNFVRRANSDWHDIGVYGSSEEKWAHSLIPTLRHPFSTLRYLANPYWLEDKNYWTRPYPVTGKMFEEGSPWGAILNPTVGELIKPQKRMHERELGSGLVDVRALIAERNAAIRAKAEPQLIKITNTGAAEPISFTALSTPTGNEQIVSMNMRRGRITPTLLGTDYPSTVPSIQEYDSIYGVLQARALGNTADIGYSDGISSNELRYARLSLRDSINANADAGGIFGGIAKNFLPTPIETIAYQNQATFQKAAAAKQNGIVTPDTVYSMAGGSSQLLTNSEFLADLKMTTSRKDLLGDASYSMKELGGIYGFLYDEIMPGGTRRARLQSADRMESFSRQFWDASVGGLGGEFMEIARRFFPHEDHSVERINNIQNMMPEWMPARFRFGDPYESIPKGEMRLPGAGYEDINQLHPDMYGKYGAFDRMKILADVAPWSQEYKLWRSIATRTTKDPELKAQIKEIRKRVKEQSSSHDFYNYRFNGDTLDQKRAVISEMISDNAFKIIGDDRIYRFAGIKYTGGEEKVGIEKYIGPGTGVILKYSENKYSRNNSDGSVSAIVIANGQNMNRYLLDQGVAQEKEDNTAAGNYAGLTQSQIDRGKFYEMIGHLPIPYIHSKFMRINSPLEAYKDEQIYGTSYATWSHPIQGFVVPAFEKAWGRGPLGQTMALGAWGIAAAVHNHESQMVKVAANAAFALMNPGAFAGGMMGWAAKVQAGPLMKWGAHAGAAVGLAGYAVTRLDKPIDSTINFAMLGSLIGKQLENAPGRGAIIGAAVGLGLSSLKNPDFDKDRMFGAYVPGKVKKRWEVQEYYDRLEYIKYMGLYEKAADMAKRKEGVDIRTILNKMEIDKEKREKLRQQLVDKKERISNMYSEGDSRAEAIMAKLDEKLRMLDYPTQVLKAGKYTKSALAYKQAAESTIYGLKDDATWVQIARAIPKLDRDYLMEFMKEQDPKKRKEIMKYVSPYERKILQIAWGQKPTKQKSNLEYFANYQLPGTFWAGWRPDVDLENIEIKTIQNEGMMLSDFGFYESQAKTPEVQEAPILDIYQDTTGLELKKNLMTALSGAGLIGVDVSIEPSSQSGIQAAVNLIRITDYQVRNTINGVLGRM